MAKHRLPILLILCSVLLISCGPSASRSGPGTGSTRIDAKALSTKLDRADIDYMVKENLDALFDSRFWIRDVEGADRAPIVAILPIRNETAEHIDDEMGILLSSIETTLVNSGDVQVVTRERQEQMIQELGMQRRPEIDSTTAGQLGKQLGAQYYVTGKLGAVAERVKKTRRMQYNLFLQLIEIETSLVKFQHESVRTKQVKG